MKLNFKTVGAPALILFVICLCVSGLLGITNQLTKDQIAATQKQREEESRRVVLSDAEDFEPGTDDSYYIGKKGGEIAGYVFVTESKGYGGTIKVMSGIGADGQIKGVVILSHNETPGLGANAVNKSFTDGYKQEAKPLEVTKSAGSGEGKVQAITGATITTKAVTDAVNLAVEKYQSVKEGN